MTVAIMTTASKRSKKAKEKSQPSAESAPAPGAGAIEIDQSLLTKAVAEINQLHRGKCEAIGRYLLKTFFKNDLSLYRAPSDNRTFFALQMRKDLEVPYSTLCMILNTMAQREVLGEDLADALDFSHQTRLVSVRNQERKLELAQRAVDEEWTVKQLDEAIRGTKKGSAGGSVTPARVNSCFMKLDGVVKSLRDKSMTKYLSEIDGKKRKDLAKKIERDIKELQKLQDLLASPEAK